jgi:hypothetical protein
MKEAQEAEKVLNILANISLKDRMASNVSFSRGAHLEVRRKKVS